MTTRDAVAAMEARVAYDSARRRLELQAFAAYNAGRPLTAYKAMAAARRLTRFAPSELLVVKDIG